jgi:alkylated DNA repair dioxygenase AlkB
MFSVSSATIQRIAEEQAGFAVMMTYVMLARGAGNNGTLRMSSYTAQNISSRTQLEHARIEEAVRWLTDKKIIAVPQEHHEHFKWVMQDDQQDIYLPASLTDSKHQAPPMMRLFDPQAQASVDKLVVLLTYVSGYGKMWWH